MSSWKEWNGEQGMQECLMSKGFLLRFEDASESNILQPYPRMFNKRITHYWIIPDDPLREMKIRQAMTGQPVWIKEREMTKSGFPLGYKYYETTTPDWGIPNAEYSFKEFDDRK